MRHLSLLAFCCLLLLGLPAQTSQQIFLSGTDKDNTVDWEFYCTDGRRSGEWTTIPVPSQWELQGFGTYSYGRPWDDHPKEEGRYRYRFTPAAELAGKHVNLVFDGVMTDATVRLNGQSVGPTHRGAFYRFRYDVTELLRPGVENLLEVEVKKHSEDESVNGAERRADYWIFGGIFRPVWLEVLPEEHIEHFAVDARADGSLNVIARIANRSGAGSLEAVISTWPAQEEVHRVSQPVTGDTVRLTTTTPGVIPWSAEYPNRYQLALYLRPRPSEAALHQTEEIIGFRTVELRPHDGLYVNGIKIHLRGVNRHCFWPETGRTTGPDVDLLDAEIVKDMNMNAVRMSHYPPDANFLYVADSLGLYILDELAGWQDAYSTEVGTPLVKELIERDVNHPSVIIWDNGNEGGNNHELLPLYGRYDPQQRTVIHPWAMLNNTDTKHYRPFDCCVDGLFHGNEVFFPTEYLHGMYDGGHGAGLEDYWNAMRNDPQSAGGFLWNLADEGIVRTDQDGFIDTDGNQGADGIVGPHREKEGSFYTIRNLYAPVHFEEGPLAPEFDGRLRVENRFYRTDLGDCTVRGQLLRFGDPDTEPSARPLAPIITPELAPGLSTYLELNLPADWSEYDALELTAEDPYGRLINSWVFPILRQKQAAERYLNKLETIAAPLITQGDREILVRVGELNFHFANSDGRLLDVDRSGIILPLTNGPRLTADTVGAVTQVNAEMMNGKAVITATYDGGFQQFTWTVHPTGALELDYAYLPMDRRGKYGSSVDYLGVNFDLREDGLAGSTDLMAGPFRVYKNRMRGPQVGRWRANHNDAITGLVWEYPEYKGYFRDFYWSRLAYPDGTVTVMTTTPGLFLRRFTPELPEDARPGVQVAYPEGDISFLHAIPPIGTKFHLPENLGPMSQKARYSPTRGEDRPFRGRLYFIFEEYVD